MKLLVSDYEVQTVNENTNSEFIVKFEGPKDSAYEGVSTQYIYHNFIVMHSNEVMSALVFSKYLLVIWIYFIIDNNLYSILVL